MYGLGRIGEQNATSWSYHLPDALGSVRQVSDSTANITFAQTYEPFGDVLTTAGSTASNYGFSGEWTDGTGLINLRARYLNTGIGRFITRDTWPGNYQRPLSLNGWNYVEGNPVNFTDPSGHIRIPGGGGSFVSPVRGYNSYNYDPLAAIYKYLVCDFDNRIANSFPLGFDQFGTDYNPMESTILALSLVWNWFWESGPDEYVFGPEESLTQDIIHEPGVTEFKKAWAEAGYPLPFVWHHTADHRIGKSLTIPGDIINPVWVFTREHGIALPLSIAGLGSPTPEGLIDPVGGTIGSLDTITVIDAGNGQVFFTVSNAMDRASGSRIPGTDYSVLPSVPREEFGPGGTITQTFYWYENMPIP